jgi:hypothetical protein
LLGLLALPAALLLLISVSRIVYPFDVGNYEALVWDSAVLSASGQNPYAHALQPPFVVAPYGYLYYLIVGLGLKLFGLQLWLGRMLSLLGMLSCLGSVVWIVRAVTRNLIAATLAATVVITSWPVAVWTSLQRPDFVGLAFAYAGLALLYRSSPEKAANWRASLGAMLLFTAGFLCKMTLVLPFLLGAARLYQTGRRREALAVLLGTLSLIGAAMLLLNGTSEGGYFWQQFGLLGRIPESLSNAFRWLRALALAPASWIAVSILVAGGWRALRSPPCEKSLENHSFTRLIESPAALAFVYLGVASGVAFYTSMRSGSNLNYYLETVLALGLATGMLVARSRPLLERALPLTLALALTGSVSLVRLGRGEYYRWKSLPYYQELVRTLAENTPAGALCVSFNPELVTAAGRTFHFADFMFYDELATSDTLRGLFNEAIRSRRYSAFLWGKDDARFPGYQRVPMRTPLPDHYYPLYFYLRNDLAPARPK